MAYPPGACPNMEACRMYSLFRLAGTLMTWKVRYCTNDFTSCERFRRSTAGERVPDNLLPNGQLLRMKADAK